MLIPITLMFTALYACMPKLKTDRKMGAEGSHLAVDEEPGEGDENGVHSKNSHLPSSSDSSSDSDTDDNDNVEHNTKRTPLYRPPSILSCPPQNVSFACRFCLEKFERKPQAVAHMKTCPSRSHRSPKGSPSSGKQEKKSPNPNNSYQANGKNEVSFSTPTTRGFAISKHKGEKSFNCQHCGKLFLSISGLKYHESSHSDRERKHRCKLCSKKFLLPVTKRKHEERCANKTPEERAASAKNACRFCGKHFRLEITLKIHENGHKGVKPKFKCGSCNFRSKYLASLNRHRTSCHPGSDDDDGKRIKSETDRGTNRPSTSKAVSNKKTVNALISKCLKCPLTFADSQNFVDHVKGHCGKKPFLCLVCGKWFRFSQDIKTHTEQLHPFLSLFNFCDEPCKHGVSEEGV